MIAFRTDPTSPPAAGEAERLFEEFFSNSPLALVVSSLDRDRVLAVNRRAAEVLHVLGIDAVGRPSVGFYADPADRTALIRTLRETGHVNDQRVCLQRHDGSTVWVVASARCIEWNGEAAILAGFSDLTPQIDAESALATSERRLAGQSRALTALTERSARVQETLEARIDAILRTAAQALDVERVSVWCFTRAADSIECIGLFQHSPSSHRVGSRIPRSIAPAYFGAVESERVIAAHDARTDRRTSSFAGSYLEPNSIGAMLDVPLRQADGTKGLLCIEHVGGPRIWTLDEQNFAIAVANLISVAVAESDLKAHEAEIVRARVAAEQSRDGLDRELANAGCMQQLILPRSLPAHPRASFAAHYQTSRHAGGDYYDVIPIDADRFAVVVVDVSGHGASAAIVMAMIRAVIHTYPVALDDPPAVLAYLNRHFEYLWDSAMHATAIVAVLDTARGTLRLSSAGHPAPLVIRRGQVTPLPALNGLFLLWAQATDHPVVEERLQPGDRVVFYTDGITDRCRSDDSRFETDRLRDVLAESSHLGLGAMVESVVSVVETFAEGAEPDDDQTLLAIEWPAVT